MYLGTRLLLLLLWLLHWLPLCVLAPMGRGLGWLLHRVASSRRRIALRNIELCFPELSPTQQEHIVRDHFGWLARSALERGILFYASPKRLRRLIQIDGNPRFADENPDQPVMWLVPHFVGLDIAAIATQLNQNRPAASIYQAQSNPIMDEAVRKARLRLGKAVIFSRQQGLIPVMRAVRREGMAFFNLPDQDFGMQDAEFVPFFDIPAATLTAPSRIARTLNMKIVPIIAEMLPGSQGYRVHYRPPLPKIPTDDAFADTLKINKFIEQEIRNNPSQYLWVHRRFKTRPPGIPSLYEKHPPH